jgi:class 3 adenylate cyclase
MTGKEAAPTNESRRPLAILFTDIVGSSEYFARQGDAAGMALISRHNSLLQPVVDAAGGRVVKTIGDSILATFEDLGQAVRAAWVMQQTLARENAPAPGGEKINIRIGVHYGLVFERSGDVFGDAVNMAERVKSKAGGGQIVISRVVRDLLRADPAIQVRSIGLVDLKGSPEPIELYELTSAPTPGKAARAKRSSFAWTYGLAAVLLVVALYVGWRLVGAHPTPHAARVLGPQDLATVSLLHWTSAGVREEVPPQGATFSSGEKFQIEYHSLRTHFLYAAFFDANKSNFMLVFPDRESLEPLKAGETVRIPGQGYIELDNQPRTETIRLILSTQPIEALENLAQSGEQGSPSLLGILERIKGSASTQACFRPDRAGPGMDLAAAEACQPPSHSLWRALFGPGKSAQAALDSRPAWLDLEINHR